MGEDIRIVVHAVAFVRDDRSNPDAAVVVAVVACSIVAVEHNIVVAWDRLGNLAGLRDDEASPCMDFHSAACVLAADSYDAGALDSTYYLLDVVVVAAVAVVLDPPAQVTRLLFQRQLQSSLLLALTIG